MKTQSSFKCRACASLMPDGGGLCGRCPPGVREAWCASVLGTAIIETAAEEQTQMAWGEEWK